MNRLLVTLSILSAAASCTTTRPAAQAPPPPPPAPVAASAKASAFPPSRIEDAADDLFHQNVPDPYRWLENATSPEVQAWMKAQDELARGELARLPGREVIASRLKQLLYVESVTPPVHRGNRFFYSRRHADKEKAIIYFREGEKGAEQVLIDPNTLSEDGSISVHGYAPTYDGKSVAYSLHNNNADYGTIHVMEVATRKISAIDRIPEVRGVGSWTPRGDGFYYTHFPQVAGVSPADRTAEALVKFHQIGADPSQDSIIREKMGDPKRFQAVAISRDGHWLILAVNIGTGQANDLYFRDARKKNAAWQPLVVGVAAAFRASVWKDRFYVRTNDGAPNWRAYQVDPMKPARKDWKEIVPEDKTTVLEGLSVVGDRLSLLYLRNVANELEVRKLDGAMVRKIPLPGLGVSSGVIGDPDQDDAYFSFSSFTQPPAIYKTSIKRGATKVWFSVQVPIDPAPYLTEQVWFNSKDGTKVPMFLVHRKDFSKNGTTPFILTGYGGFNQPLLPSFSATLFPWLEAGGGFALVNLRGGGEFGEVWHKAGMKTSKQNVFDDFIAAAEYLVQSGYTRSDKLAIRGGSNGGLLVGAALTQRPDLFGAVICAVPLLDMVRYHLFGLGKLWIPEYGSADNEQEFRALYAYSPYHHVKAETHYPATLILSADSDDRVDPMHARKMAAALQAAAPGDRPIWLRIEHNASHGGADLIKQTVEQTADIYAFLMRELGVQSGHGVSARE